MRILVVSSYPPRRCGIGAYAAAQVRALREAGHDVTVLSPPDGDGDVRAPFVGGAAFLRAAAIGGRFDGIVLHFQPALYFAPRRPVSKVLTAAALLALAAARGRTLEILVHEADPPSLMRPDYLMIRTAFQLAGRVSFHTQAERASFERDYRLTGGRRRRGIRSQVVPHLSASTGAVPPRAEARRLLRVTEEPGPMLVCTGFIQPSKGFDRALEAFARVFRSGDEAGGGASALRGSLYLVGSVREDTAENRLYAHHLRRRAREVPGVHLVERFVSDQEFDLWVAAADRVVLPYRRSWSSGVLARAHQLGISAIVCDVGGLAEQAAPSDAVVEGDEGLVKAFEALAAVAREGSAP